MNALSQFAEVLLGLGTEPKELTFLQVSIRGLIIFVTTLIMVRLSSKLRFRPGNSIHQRGQQGAPAWPLSSQGRHENWDYRYCWLRGCAERLVKVSIFYLFSFILAWAR
jgi:hypothetical protein